MEIINNYLKQVLKDTKNHNKMINLVRVQIKEIKIMNQIYQEILVVEIRNQVFLIKVEIEMLEMSLNKTNNEFKIVKEVLNLQTT